MERLTRIERLSGAIYSIWFFIHLAFLFYADAEAGSVSFWPFIKNGQSLYTTYDVFEFLVYIGTPLLAYIVYKILFTKSYEEQEQHIHQKHSTHSFFRAFLDEKIKVEELTQKINALNNQPVNFDYLEELKKDKQKITTHGLNNWLEKLEVKKKYKEFQQK
jgi:hypothetical protein